MLHDKNQIKETISALKQQRDQLALQIHLGAMEARDEFEAAKDKLDQMTAQFDPVKDAVDESASNVIASLKLVGEEILASFNRVRESLK